MQPLPIAGLPEGPARPEAPTSHGVRARPAGGPFPWESACESFEPSFLENFSGRDREAPKLALYRLWLGSAPDKLTCLTRASGDGKWGQMGDAYFLADGDPERLAPVFAQWEKSHGKAVYGGGKTQLPPITDKPLTQQTLTALKNLPVDAPSK